jgi:hypothetical protein
VNGEIEEKKSQCEKMITPKAVTVNDWDYNEYGQCGPQHWLKLCGCEHLGSLAKKNN